MKRIILTFGLVLTGLALFGQSPRIRLNQITKDSLTGSVVLSGSDSNMVYSRDFFLNLTDSVLILFGDTLSTTATAFTGVATDLTLTGNGTVGTPLKVDTAIIATVSALADSVATKGTVTSVAVSGGTGISVSGSPITTSGTITVTNTAPDQTVSITGAGINTVTGTYPNFTITGTEVNNGTVTGITAGTFLSGGTITTSGTIALDTASAGLKTYISDNKGTVNLVSGVTGTLPVANGGTGATTLTANKVLVGNGTSAVLQPTNLHWDNTNSRLGIGREPGTTLDVQSTGSAILRLKGATGNSMYGGLSNSSETMYAFGDAASIVGGSVDQKFIYWTNTSIPIIFYIGQQQRFIFTSDGFLGVGVETPNSNIHIKAGSTSVAPLKFTSGTNLTTPEAGAMEWNGTNLFLTNSGATRQTINQGLTGSATLDFGSTNAQSSADLTITVTGASDGDVVSLGVPNGSVNANTSYSAWVSAANTVTVRFNNYSSGSVDPASGTFKVFVTKF